MSPTWKNLNHFRSVSAFVLATFFGTGLLPLAPGTFGTLAAIPLAYFTSDLQGLYRFLFWVGVLLLGSWAAYVVDETMGTSDNQNIVIDEVFGFGIAAWTAGGYWENYCAAFLLFRFFDIVKIPPVRQLDRWSKSHPTASFLKGFGVMADDGVAGIQAFLVLWMLQSVFHYLPA